MDYNNNYNMGFTQQPERPKPRIGVVLLAIIISLAIGAGGMYAYLNYTGQNKCATEAPVEKVENKGNNEQTTQEEKNDEQKQEENKTDVSYSLKIVKVEQIVANNMKGDTTINYGGKDYKIHVEIGEDGAEYPGDTVTINGVSIIEPGDDNYLIEIDFLTTGYIAVNYYFSPNAYEHVTYYDADLKKSCAIEGVTGKIDYNYTPSTNYKCSK